MYDLPLPRIVMTCTVQLTMCERLNSFHFLITLHSIPFYICLLSLTKTLTTFACFLLLLFPVISSLIESSHMDHNETDGFCLQDVPKERV